MYAHVIPIEAGGQARSAAEREADPIASPFSTLNTLRETDALESNDTQVAWSYQVRCAQMGEFPMTEKKSGRREGARGGRKGFVPKGNLRYDRHDSFYRKAKEEGFLARSVYKLEEIDRDFSLIRRADWVLDLGCAPGSWLQYAERKVREHGGRLVGIDLLPVRTSFGPHVKILEADLYETPVAELMPPGNLATRKDASRPFDVVMSDMAPNTTGIRSVDQARSMALAEHALELSGSLLAPGGRFVVKIFEGGDFKAYLDRAKQIFQEVKVRRPKGTRVGSIETYVIGLGCRVIPASNLAMETVSHEESP